MKPQNPPAFPSPTAPSLYGAWGMTLRDYFAAAALPYVIEHVEKMRVPSPSHPDDCLYLGASCSEDRNLIAEYSYAVADAMLEHRLYADQASAAPAQTAQEGGE